LVVCVLPDAHAACPPPFGSEGAGAGRRCSLGLPPVMITSRPVSACRRSISRRLEAHGGWTCRVAVCMVYLGSVVERRGKSTSDFVGWSTVLFVVLFVGAC